MRLTAALLLLSLPMAALGAWNPQGWERSPQRAGSLPTNPAEVTAGWLLAGYRNNLSPIDAARCPSFPTCSTYAVQAVHLHGPLTGAILTAARLISEGDEGLFAPYVRVDGVEKVWYPVEKSLLPKEQR